MMRWWWVPAAALMVASCGRQDEGATWQAAEQAMEPAAPGSAASPAAPQMAYAYRLGFTVPGEAMQRLQEAHVALCDRLGPARCQLLTLTRDASEGRAGGASTAMRVDARIARGFSRTLEQTAGPVGGRVSDMSVEAEDVSRQISDTDARIRQRTLLVERLTEILRSRTGAVAELVQAERQVAEAQEELDKARSWAAELRGRVSMSAFDISYAAVAPSAGGAPARVGDAVAGSASLFVRGLAEIVEIVIYLAPWLAAGGLGWLAWSRLRPRLRRWRRPPGDVD